MQPVKDKLKALWLSPIVQKASHTFWQAFLATFMVGVPLLMDSVNKHSYAATKAVLISLATAAFAAGLSAVKTALVSWREG